MEITQHVCVLHTNFSALKLDTNVDTHLSPPTYVLHIMMRVHRPQPFGDNFSGCWQQGSGGQRHVYFEKNCEWLLILLRHEVFEVQSV